MPNDYFQFQQFRIAQSDCAQKVSTDACLLGAAADLTGATRVLDIGTGTGLLALMAAQRAPGAQIEAIELDAATAAQAARNVAASPWAGRIVVHPLSLAAYAASQPGLFSHIICNPPFFRRSLASPDAARATARHEGAGSLTFGELAGFAAAHLAPGGTLTVLLPPPEMQQFAQVAQQEGLAVQGRLAVRHRPGGRVTRGIWQFGAASPAPLREASLCIQDATGAYSAEFRALLAGFYLAL
ncbi:tRNA1(Val) (adenine(37)-N6)-methyltransferase [Hymenobacter cheonanensis]|uniref:tRNA1(Val) (adenine(37)-N6)-methyltransferase n=1 Tax=Hymenobacter sp. CA2-7 TaxID=3063993 RepID=UPI0027143750|nr:methyltransferase [Hymenobacter sp. CA2-7]MDO7883732.1 methyltransferase [Hymenobacter sp. CA2-7]